MAQVNRSEGLVGNTGIKAPCRVASTGNLALSGEQTIDAVACVTGDRVLVRSQTNAVENGIWVVDTGSWVRAQDFDGVNDISKGTAVMVVEGATYPYTIWKITTSAPAIGNALAISLLTGTYASTANLSFLQAGAGAVARIVQDKEREIFSITDFGAIGDDVTDSTASVNACIAAILARAAIPAGIINGETIAGAVFTPAGVFRVDNILIPKGNNNLTFYGDGWGSIWRKKAATGITPVVTLNGDITKASNVDRCMQVSFRDMCIDGNGFAAEIGIYGQKVWRGYFDNLRIFNCKQAMHFIGASEYYLRNIFSVGDLSAGSVGIYHDGRYQPVIGGNTLTLDKGFCENFRVENSWIGNYENGMIMDHSMGADVSRSYFSPYGKSALVVRSSGINAAPFIGSSDDTSQINIHDCWFELSPAAGYGIIEIQAMDLQHIRKVNVHCNHFATMTDQTTILIQSGINGASLGGLIHGLSVKDNELNHSATLQYPCLLKENPDYCFDTVVKDNFPLGMYGGSRFGLGTQFQEFDEVIYVPAIWNATADAASWCNGLDGWASDVAVRKTAVADTFQGYAGPQCGNGAEVASIQLYRDIDVSQWRDKVVMVSFLAKSNLPFGAANTFSIQLNGAGADILTGGSDLFFSRLDIDSQVTAAEAAAPAWRRYVYFVPINPVYSGGAGGFGVNLAATMRIFFRRPAGLAADYLRVCDLRVKGTMARYNRTYI